MRVILNELGKRVIAEQLRPRCAVCHRHRPRHDRDFVNRKGQYWKCAGCGRLVDAADQTSYYRARWDEAYRAVRKDRRRKREGT